VAAAAARRQELEKEVTAVLEQHRDDAQATKERCLFLQPRLMSALGWGIPAAEALAGALEAWQRDQQVAVRKQAIQKQVADLLEQHKRAVEPTDDELDFLQPLLVASLGRGTPASDALADALKEWGREQQLRQLPAAVSDATDQVGITGFASVGTIEAMATAKLERGGSLEVSVQAAIDEWVTAAAKLERLAEEQRIKISDADSEHMVGVIIGKRTSMRDALVEHMLSEAASQHRLNLSFSALKQTIKIALERGSKMQAAVQAVVGEWMWVEAAVAAEATRWQIDTRGPDGWVEVADLFGKFDGHKNVEQVVLEAVDEWQIRADALEAERRRRNLVVQSIWDASTNVTTVPQRPKKKAAAESPPRAADGRVRVVGITGPSGAGKSSVAPALAELCGGAPIIHQYDFMKASPTGTILHLEQPKDFVSVVSSAFCQSCFDRACLVLIICGLWCASGMGAAG
jgi:hypothetical protein